MWKAIDRCILDPFADWTASGACSLRLTQIFGGALAFAGLVTLALTGCVSDVELQVGDSADNVTGAPADIQTTTWRGDRRFEEVTANEATPGCGEVRIVFMSHAADYTAVEFADGTRGLRPGVWGTEIGETFNACRVTRDKFTEIYIQHYERRKELTKYDVTWR
jgi:hypothetical protein